MGNSKMTWATIALVAVGVILLAGILVWGSTQKKETPKNEEPNPVVTEQPTTPTGVPMVDDSEAGKLGVNEKSITAADFDAVVIKADKPYFVDVYSPTCPHCIKVGPILTELSNQYLGKAYFGKMNSADSNNLQFITDQKISGVPTVLVYKNGKKVGQIEGSKTIEDYKTEINKYL